MNSKKRSFQPKPGSSIKVDPIRDPTSIARIKTNLEDKPRDLCLFTLGINTAYRGGELLSITVGQVRNLGAGDTLELKQSKNKKYRATTLNPIVVAAIENWLNQHPYRDNADSPLFLSAYRKDAITVSRLNHLVKRWCKGAGLAGNYGSHSLRKTWGYHQRVRNGTHIALLMVAFGHSTEKQTLSYLGIQTDEIKELFEMEL